MFPNRADDVWSAHRAVSPTHESCMLNSAETQMWSNDRLQKLSFQAKTGLIVQQSISKQGGLRLASNSNSRQKKTLIETQNVSDTVRNIFQTSLQQRKLESGLQNDQSFDKSRCLLSLCTCTYASGLLLQVTVCRPEAMSNCSWHPDRSSGTSGHGA